jgi:hypothetical protein
MDSTQQHFQPSAAYEEIKRRQDKLTYTPGLVLGLLAVGDAFIGEHVGTGPMGVLLVPLAVGSVVWWVLLARASVKTWRTPAAEQRAWKAHQRKDIASQRAQVFTAHVARMEELTDHLVVDDEWWRSETH